MNNDDLGATHESGGIPNMKEKNGMSAELTLEKENMMGPKEKEKKMLSNEGSGKVQLIRSIFLDLKCKYWPKWN